MEVAEVNNIIVLFPQIAAIAANPASCWDWFGYLNTLFGMSFINTFRMLFFKQYVFEFLATRQGNQVLATHRMMTRIVHG